MWMSTGYGQDWGSPRTNPRHDQRYALKESFGSRPFPASRKQRLSALMGIMPGKDSPMYPEAIMINEHSGTAWFSVWDPTEELLTGQKLMVTGVTMEGRYLGAIEVEVTEVEPSWYNEEDNQTEPPSVTAMATLPFGA